MTRENEGVLTGRYQGSGRGFGFFIPDGAAGRGGDCFVPPRREGGAWDGDAVEAVLEEAGPAQPGRRTARVVKILERGNPIVTGVVRRENRKLWLYPDNERLPGPIQIAGRGKIRAGEKAAVAVDSYGGAAAPPLGTVKAGFGPAGTRQAAVEAALYRQGVERTFPEEVLEEARHVPQTVPARELPGRLDLRGETVVTIDGAASKDLDDAVSLRRDGANWALGVHIADVSAYVRPGTALDQEAFRRGTSVYFADQVAPMLPVELSNGVCSLNPGVDRLTLSCLMTLNGRGEVVEHAIAKSVIRSAERMTYADCNLLLGGEGDEALRAVLAERYATVLPMLRDMAALAKKLERRRRNRGGLDLDARESCLLCNSQGDPIDIQARRQGVSEKLIESFMLAANETVAEHLSALQFPAVYRVHEKPSAEKTENLRAMLSPLGLTLRDASGRSIQKVLDAVKDTPKAPAVGMMVLRSMMKARYSPQNLGHFGLAAPCYCHFTSPIRRYPDLMVHRCLHALLDGKPSAAGRKKLAAACAAAAEQSSRREIAAQTAERDIDKLYFADYMKDHLGETFPAAVSGATRFGLFAALPSGVEGFIPVETLPRDRYVYDENTLTLAGERTGLSFPFGMELEVVCAAADPGTGRIEFRLPGREEAPARPAEKKPAPKAHRAAPGRGKGRGNRPAMHVPRRDRKGRRR